MVSLLDESFFFLLQALTYRVGHHSTSDDSTKYRSAEEIEWWKLSRDPVSRYRKWIESNGWWNDELEMEHRGNMRKQVSFAPSFKVGWVIMHPLNMSIRVD